MGLGGKFGVTSDLKTGYWSLGSNHVNGDDTNKLYKVTCSTASECDFTEIETEKLKRSMSIALMVPNSGIYQCPMES